MPEQPLPTVRGRVLEPPGKGPWELESTHASRPMTPVAQECFSVGFVRGFKEGTARYGMLLDHLEPGFSQSLLYHQPVAVGAPPGALKPPPKLVLQLMSRLHPEIRRRNKASQRAFRDKIWRDDLTHWDDVDKPDIISRHRAIQSVDVGGLSDAELADHVDRCVDHAIFSAYMHHKYTIPAMITVGDFLAGARQWTGASIGELLGPLRGHSAISRGFASDELDVAAKRLAVHPDAQAVLHGGGSAERILAELCQREDVGEAVAAYLDAVRWRCVGYDLGDKTAGELPGALVESLRTTLAGTSAPPDGDAGLAAIRARVPAEHLDEFDDRLAEVRLMYRLRDERGVFSDGWASGLARRALLEAGRRLASTGKLNDAEHAVDMRASEIRALLDGGSSPSAAEVQDRFEWRNTVTTSEAPEFLRALPPPPPPPEWLPAASRRGAESMNVALGALFGVPETPNTATVLHGLAVNSGVYEGTARLVEDAADFGRIKKGDVLVTRMTSPYFNVVLPMLGGIVTDRGGQLCHAAIVAREYDIPGIVGTREATRRIADGSRVRIDGSTGEVRLLG